MVGGGGVVVSDTTLVMCSGSSSAPLVTSLGLGAGPLVFETGVELEADCVEEIDESYTPVCSRLV